MASSSAISAMFPHRITFERKLIQLFINNDGTNKGYLSIPEVNTFLIQLKLDISKDNIITSLLERIHDKDKFKDLKAVILTFYNASWEIQSYDSPLSILQQDRPSLNSALYAPPKLVIGSKKYGRRSLHYLHERGALKSIPKRKRGLI